MQKRDERKPEGNWPHEAGVRLKAEFWWILARKSPGGGHTGSLELSPELGVCSRDCLIGERTE